MSLVRNVTKVTYSNNCSQSSESWKWVLDVLKVNLSSSEWASTLLPAGVLAAKLLGKVFSSTDLILTKNKLTSFRKKICVNPGPIYQSTN